MADYFTTYEMQCYRKGRIAGLRAAALRLRKAKRGYGTHTLAGCELLDAARWCEAEIRKLEKEVRRG